MEIDLLSGNFICDKSSFSNETMMASRALSKTFKDLLVVEKIDIKDIERANINFYFIRGRWPSSCEIAVVIGDGRDVYYKVDQFGNIFGRKFRRK